MGGKRDNTLSTLILFERAYTLNHSGSLFSISGGRVGVGVVVVAATDVVSLFGFSVFTGLEEDEDDDDEEDDNDDGGDGCCDDGCSFDDSSFA